jgi:23S rRNA G2445 N2-methylase RlmL
MTHSALQTGRVPILWAVDINPAACAATRGTATANVLQDDIEVLNADYTTASLSRWAGLVDVLIFNPPYVPTPSEEIKWGYGIYQSIFNACLHVVVEYVLQGDSGCMGGRRGRKRSHRCCFTSNTNAPVETTWNVLHGTSRRQ